MAALASALVWGVATVLFTLAIRKGGKIEHAVLLKNLLGATLLGGLAWFGGESWGGGEAGLGNLSWLLLSGFLGLALGDFLYFYALARIGVARTLILLQLVPVVTAALAWVFLSETLNRSQCLGALLVVAGGILARSPKSQRNRADALGYAAAFICVLLFAVANLLTHYGMTETGVLTAASWRLAAGALGAVGIGFARHKGLILLKSTIQATTWRSFFWPSIFGTCLGMGLFTAGLKFAKQGVAASMAAATPLISIPLAYWILGEKPNQRSWLGAILVLIGVAVMAIASV
jgi:drug/metabolite transporter (DMT)-like permease